MNQLTKIMMKQDAEFSAKGFPYTVYCFHPSENKEKKIIRTDKKQDRRSLYRINFFLFWRTLIAGLYPSDRIHLLISN